MNLATNAAHAMKQGGRMEIALEPFYAKDHWVRAHPEMREGLYIVLRVQDTGHGMSPEVRSRAMEPFFTTKETGAGSGLGLAMVHGIMREHEGLVELESEPGVGTTVRCLFPAIAEGPVAAVPEAESTPRGRGERILFLDDEPTLARLGERRLADLGYQVTAVTDPGKVIEALATGTFDLLVTDYTMPRMTGLELTRRVREAGRALPVILLSGVSSELATDEVAAAGVTLLLGKPVTTHDLAVAIRATLDRKAGSPPA